MGELTIGELHDSLEPGGSVVINGWKIARLPAPPRRPDNICPRCGTWRGPCTDPFICEDTRMKRLEDQ